MESARSHFLLHYQHIVHCSIDEKIISAHQSVYYTVYSMVSFPPIWPSLSYLKSLPALKRNLKRCTSCEIWVLLFTVQRTLTGDCCRMHIAKPIHSNSLKKPGQLHEGNQCSVWIKFNFFLLLLLKLKLFWNLYGGTSYCATRWANLWLILMASQNDNCLNQPKRIKGTMSQKVFTQSYLRALDIFHFLAFNTQERKNTVIVLCLNDDWLADSDVKDGDWKRWEHPLFIVLDLLRGEKTHRELGEWCWYIECDFDQKFAVPPDVWQTVKQRHPESKFGAHLATKWCQL